MNSVTQDLPVLDIERVITGSREDVFDAWLDPELLKLWFCGGETHVSRVEVDARVGGAYRIVMSEADRDWDHSGTYLELDRPSRLVFTWHTPSTNFGETRVTVTLTDDDAGTRLRLRHESLPTDTFEPHRKGWMELFTRLDASLA